MNVIRQLEGLKANGHYALAVVHQGCIYVSGQFSIDMATGERKPGTVKEETRRVLENIRSILRASGSDVDRILRATVYIDDMENWESVNQVYSEFFGEKIHARSVACVKELHYGFKIEMDVIAAT